MLTRGMRTILLDMYSWGFSDLCGSKWLPFFSVCAGGKTRTGIVVKRCRLSQKAGSVKVETTTADNRTVLMISIPEIGTDTHRHQPGSPTTLIGRYS